MKRPKKNSIDLYIDLLTANFSKINNFHLLQETEEGKHLFDLIVKTNADLNSLQGLFLNYYIPAANKSIAESWSQISKSTYKHLLNLTKDDLKDNLYETIRLGYVGLFHKYEAYLKALVKATDFLLQEINDMSDLLSIKDYCKKEFGIDIYKSHHHFYITSRISYISNCIKHYDSHPIKKPIHQDFINSDKSKKIEISKECFKADIEDMKKHCELLLSQIMIIGFKQILDHEFYKSKDENLLNNDIKEKYLKAFGNFQLVLSDFIRPKSYFSS
jgi:hypothetical protein